MKHILLILSLFFINIKAETIKVDYKVEFGIVGEIGIAHAKLTKNSNSYEIDIKLESTGVTKVLSGDRKEEHISKGHIENGILVSDMYQILKSHGSKTSNRVYTIDHKTKKVTRVDKKWKRGELYKEKTKIMKIYSKDDLLTLYFNLHHYIKDKKLSRDYRFSAVGAEIQKGFVSVHIPSSQEMPEYKELLGEGGDWYARAIVHQKIFSSDKGELFLSISKEGVTKRAVLKDLILFGDIRAFKMNKGSI
jgi:hypothetical protein